MRAHLFELAELLLERSTAGRLGLELVQQGLLVRLPDLPIAPPGLQVARYPLAGLCDVLVHLNG